MCTHGAHNVCNGRIMFRKSWVNPLGLDPGSHQDLSVCLHNLTSKTTLQLVNIVYRVQYLIKEFSKFNHKTESQNGLRKTTSSGLKTTANSS